MSPALRLQDLSARRGEATVLHDITLGVEGGRITVILGRNGAGKSSLLEAMGGWLPHTGSVWWQDTPVAGLPRATWATRVAGLGQDERPDDELSALEVVLLGRAPHLGPWGLPSASDVDLARDALVRTDALSFAHRPMRTLSGGEKQRVQLARVLCQGAPLLLLDEPTHALDPAHALLVMNILRAETARGTTVVMVMHDLNLAARFGQDFVLLLEGTVLAVGPPSVAMQPALLHQALGVPLRLVQVEGQPVVLTGEGT